MKLNINLPTDLVEGALRVEIENLKKENAKLKRQLARANGLNRFNDDQIKQIRAAHKDFTNLLKNWVDVLGMHIDEEW